VLIRKWGVNWGVLGVVKVSAESSSCRFLDLALCSRQKNDQPCDPAQHARALSRRLILDLGFHSRIVDFLGDNEMDLFQ